jgi:hypothetical protein
MSKIIETSTAHISLLKSNIVKIKFRQNIQAGVEDIKQNHQAARKVAKGKRHLVLLDVRGFVIGTKDARTFCASQTPVPYRIAVATLVNSLAVQLRCNAFIKFNKPKIPTRIFSEEQEAINWLREFSKKEKSGVS